MKPRNRTCPDCGATLDPQERCDCQGKVDSFKIVYDSARHTGDKSVLAVARRVGDEMRIVNTIFEDEADQLYKRLTTPVKGYTPPGFGFVQS